MTHMGMEKRKGKGLSPRAAIPAALWMLIVVTLLSALAPLGLPLSRATGSAFNPATNEVVLTARGPVTAQAAPMARRDGDSLPPLALIVAILCLVPGLRRLTPGNGLATGRRAPMRPVPVRARRARAPPAPR